MKPYVESQKNEPRRFAKQPFKSATRQAVLMLHRTRDLLIRQRSSLVSAIRAHFAEFGIVVGQGIRNVERLLALLTQLRDVAERVKEAEVAPSS